MERTLCLIKPDGVKDKLIGKIIEEIYMDGFEIVNMKMFNFLHSTVCEFYKEHAGKSFFSNLIEFMRSGPCIAIVIEKDNAVADWRELIGSAYPEEAKEHTIRSRYGKGTPNNVVHGSDSTESAHREIEIIFGWERQ
jgi:nucleoside-diphosphate kinase